jgi:ElaB/YqjD/DUF883 family membrane-anchored ribosome-binding protein
MPTTIDEDTPYRSNGGASPVSARARELGRNAVRTLSDVMDTVTRRVRERDVKGALSDVRRLVHDHPGAALAAAAALGFVLARTLSRR